MIEIMRCGPLTSVQDTGRFGYRHMGVGQAGARDTLAAQQANLLLGNQPEAAVLEFNFAPLRLRFTEPTCGVLTGTDYGTRLVSDNGTVLAERMMPGHVYAFPEGSELHASNPPAPGLFACLAIAGGIEVPLVMGSRSTDLASGFGGFQGRTLHTGDRLPTGETAATGIAEHGVRALNPTGVLRAIPGPEYTQFRPQARADLWQYTWRISPDSNRMGVRLIGDMLIREQNIELTSSAVLPGVVQVPGDGQPIILGPDAQTTGGYPRIASVIRADLWQLAYLKPGDYIRIDQVDIDHALRLNTELDRHLKQLKWNLSQIRSRVHAPTD